MLEEEQDADAFDAENREVVTPESGEEPAQSTDNRPQEDRVNTAQTRIDKLTRKFREAERQSNAFQELLRKEQMDHMQTKQELFKLQEEVMQYRVNGYSQADQDFDFTEPQAIDRRVNRGIEPVAKKVQDVEEALSRQQAFFEQQLKAERLRAKFDDYDQVMRKAEFLKVPDNSGIHDLVKSKELPDDAIYLLAKDVNTAVEILALDDPDDVLERIQNLRKGNTKQQPVQKRVSSAPEPVERIKAAGSPSSFDISKMSVDEINRYFNS